ncbi:hypothetical protein B0I35DRAFT_177271 [Stachybotrys elegans]|uniref:Transcription factor domain-containing protein n=1 Tax=Stachybotrys elegans TaxID=80388 RepID=A0A8K0SDV5_9HYPO|nr:hypothetical protein B0I35DRAFT_177271 [Stachybotrys elegans]
MMSRLLRKRPGCGLKVCGFHCWIGSSYLADYFTHLSPKINPPLKDRRLINLLPDLLELDHVQVDACMLLIYYCIILQGCFLDASNERPDPQIHRHIYLSCLRTIPAWQNEANGSMTDLIAAILMTQTAAEALDFGLSWHMHKQACEYAQNLDLHNLDGTDTLNPANKMMDDADRVNMWNLIQLDMFYRLVNNKPPAFLSALNNWRVNFPWLSLDSPPTQDEAVPVVVFLARSRITLILISYFQTLDAIGKDEDILGIVGPLCLQVEQVYVEWKIDEWLHMHSQDEYQKWYLGELALSCYACILFMLCRATPLSVNQADNDNMIPRSDLSIRASRKVVEITCHMIDNFPMVGPESLSVALGTYRAHVACAHLASNIEKNPHADAVGRDLVLVQRLANCIEGVALVEKEFTPLARALSCLYYKVATKADSYFQSM